MDEFLKLRGFHKNDEELNELLFGLPDFYNHLNAEEKLVYLRRFCSLNKHLFKVKIFNNEPWWTKNNIPICKCEYDGFDPYGNYLRMLTGESYVARVPCMVPIGEIGYIVYTSGTCFDSDYNMKKNISYDEIITFVCNTIKGSADTNIVYYGRDVKLNEISYADTYVFTTLSDAIYFIDTYNDITSQRAKYNFVMKNNFKRRVVEGSKYLLEFPFKINEKLLNEYKDKESGKEIIPKRVIFELNSKRCYPSSEIDIQYDYGFHDGILRKSFREEEIITKEDDIIKLFFDKERDTEHLSLGSQLRGEKGKFKSLFRYAKSIKLINELEPKIIERKDLKEEIKSVLE